MNSKEGIYSVVEVADQCLIAFGAGARTANITPSALRAIRHRYFDAVSSLASTWDKDADAVLLNSSELGGICAEMAASAGEKAIDTPHLMEAIKELRRRWDSKGIIPCPCEPHQTMQPLG